MILFIIIGALNGQIWIPLQIAAFFVMVATAWVVFFSPFPSSKKIRMVGKYGMTLFLLSLIFVLIFRYVQYLSGRMFEDLLFSTIKRIFYCPQATLFVMFPEEQPFRLGLTWLNDLKGILPGSMQSFGYEVHHLVYGGAWGFTLAPGLIASAYVNFSMPGVYLTFLIISLVYSLGYRKLIGSRSVIDIILAVYLSFTFAINLSADFTPYIVSLLFIIIVKIIYEFIVSFLDYLSDHKCNSYFKPHYNIS